MRRCPLSCAALALCALTVAASGASVSVDGKIADENGVAVAGVRIDAAGSGLASPATAITDAAGVFHLGLPSAGAYKIRAEREGFFLFTQEGIALLDGTNLLAITLNHLKEFAESVNVNYSPPDIDVQQPAEQKQLSSPEILQIPYPASQDYRSALPMFQGVVQDTNGRLHFNGGRTDQTNYTLNGFNISDPVTGRLETRLNIDAVQTMELETSRFGPDKGRSSAGVLDVKTEMGDDRWRFSGTNFIPGVGSQDGFHIDKWTPRINISGPLLRGRAWFHNAFDTFYGQNTISGLPHGENRSQSFFGTNLSRVQVNLTPSNILTGSFLINHGQDQRQGLSFLDPIETTVNRRQNLDLTTIKDQIYFHGGALLEFGFADTRTFLRSSPQGTQTFEITPFGQRGNYFVDLTRHSNRQEWLANAFMPSIQVWGAHQFRLGADLQREGFHRTAERHDYQIIRVDASVAREVQFVGSGAGARENFEASQYVMDHWTLTDGVLVEAGVRAEWNEVVRQILLSPRFSFAYAPKWTRDTKIAAGYGIFYDALTLETLSLQQDQVSLSTFFAPDGTMRRGPVETAFLLNDRALRMPRYQTTSASVERKLPGDLFGRVNFTHRTGARGFTFVNQLSEPDLNFYVLKNGRRDRYDAVEFTVRRTFARQYEWSAGYTRSRASSSSVLDYSLESPIFAAQSAGRLSWDTPNRFLMWGWAPIQPAWFPQALRLIARETSVSFLTEYRTGFPFSIVNEEGTLVGAPNHVRFPDYFAINFAFERKFRLLHYLWAWRVGLNNATNNGNPNVVNNNIDSPAFLAFGRGQSRAVAVRLRFLGKR